MTSAFGVFCVLVGAVMVPLFAAEVRVVVFLMAFAIATFGFLGFAVVERVFPDPVQLER